MLLTTENCLKLMDEELQNKKPCRDTMIALSFYMDFAISTECLQLIKLVHDRINEYYLDNF